MKAPRLSPDQLAAFLDGRATSDESFSSDLLASFLDGRATADESLAILDALASDPNLREVLRISLAVDKELDPDRIALRAMKDGKEF